ncbi:MAG TPA: hypothetical protein GX405_15740 [Rhizobiales bacterium]|nr:hypothetical protein [Hyphomicrobiales bacterium]
MTEQSTSNRGGGGAPLVYLPAAWVAVVIVLGVRSLLSTWPLPWEYDLPESVLALIYAGTVAAVVNILWGLYLIGLAWSRSPSFPRHFTVWQVVNLVWLAATELYMQFVPEFVFSLEGLLIKMAEFGVGLVCLYLVRRDPATVAHYAGAPSTGRTPAVTRAIAAVLGVALGGATGAVLGFLLGAGIAQVTEMSCFEGACGYFAAAIGLLGLIAGAVAGGIFGFWWSGRRRARAGA